MIRLIQTILRCFAFLAGYSLHAKKQSIFLFADDVDHNYPSINANSRTFATINAAFANRFVLIPFDLMAAILLKKKNEDLTVEDQEYISSKNKLSEKINSPEEYINEYEDWRKMFYENYSQRKKEKKWESDISTEIITEEIDHNNYINKTTTYSILQTLTIYYRMCNAYLAYLDSKKSHINHKGYKIVLEGLVNTILIRSYISKYNYPIIESFQHYKNLSTAQISDTYNSITAKNAILFISIEKLIHEKIIDYKTSDISLVAQTALNFPFTYHLKNSNLKFATFWRLYSQYPEKVLKTILQFLSYSRNIDRSTFLNELEKISSSSKADYSFSNCLIYFGTSNLVPKRLMNFILKQALFTKYNKVIGHYIKALFKEKGVEIDQAYEGLPAFKAWGINDQDFNIDSAMGLFKGEAFTIAVNSFEPSLVGEKDHVNILNSEKCETILLRTIYMHCLTHCIINDSDFNTFSKNIDYTFNVRPVLIPYKKEITNFIQSVFSMTKNNLEISSFDKYSREINDSILKKSIDDIYKLKDLVNKNYSPSEKKMIFRLCDTFYAHGF